MVSTVIPVEKISYQNVVSRRKKIYYEDLDKFYIEFVQDILDANYTLRGPFFYSLNNVPKDEIIDIELFFPIYENQFTKENYKFSSYFLVDNLLKTVVFNKYNVLTEKAYSDLLLTLENSELEINTPFFHIMPMTTYDYVEILIGYKDVDQQLNKYEESAIEHDDLDTQGFIF
ncbi:MULTISPECIES: DUF5085 family protein [unclassified Enterococcus]|uniref:DUF5085 family protein n=1 Tax=unclassified Enterococcus TaxID=2608891 RepID=UPI001557B334|nr:MULTISPECIES: DUF5085 family protein [unclassified Enterococcus]MBS7576314.1 DUF5085 family protein [Enterococcus sp. MMGLQ5-2]MBS7583547.1 DUF5085 family protein [Enterococcus sp. MMGLQ5-1]NPD11409.1 DUF5085 family protein [Enterococcus sp. MMGLQ5-1]NPD36152.1 DUF5085 family protein [Enterococcus sp. MMGLQ5-2]